MWETSARLLKLLSLLARRGWSGAGLAARLEVTERTVRRAWWESCRRQDD